MVNSKIPSLSSSNTSPGSESQAHPRTQSVHEPNPSTSTAAVSHPPSVADYQTLDPFSLMNSSPPSAGSHASFLSAHLPGSAPPHAMNPSAAHMSGVNPFTTFQPSHSPPHQFQQHLAMWPFTPQQSTSFNSSHAHSADLPGFSHPDQQEQFPYHVLQTGRSGLTAQHASPGPSTSPAPSPSTSSQGQAVIDLEEAAIQEDKRRRNTAASVKLLHDTRLARFRIKKKQKSLNLERTVSDLTSRAEDLEREATDLRRENSWLKEMVIMKGRGNMTESRHFQEKEVSSDCEASNGTSDDSDKSVSQGKGGKVKGKGKGKKKKPEDKTKDKGKGREGGR